MTARKLAGMVVAVLLVTGFIPTAEASGLLGTTISWQYYAGGGAYNPNMGNSQTSGTFVADGSVDATFAEPGPDYFFNIDTTDSTITFDYSVYANLQGFWSTSPQSLAPTINNGIALDLAGAAFASVSVANSTLTLTQGGSDFANPTVTFTANEIQVDWEDLNFTNTTIVTLDVDVVPVAPEPGTWTMMAGSLLVAAFIHRRRSKRTAERPR